MFARSSRTPRFQCLRQPLQRRFASNQPADNPDFESILDKPVRLMRSGKQHGPGLIILGTYVSFRLNSLQLNLDTDLHIR
jgi:surfeit locus 1 family protein